ncbi:hypothetical protein CRUP_012511 [Coryphaenoides rupestris]|nr:hypothetical protein CRUP_012511 [Coryphaenoides rupestris]
MRPLKQYKNSFWNHRYNIRSYQYLEMGTVLVSHKSTQRQVNIKILKKEERWWSRLTLQEKKPLFLAPDFDRWQDESDAEKELQAKEEQRINKITVESRIRKDPYLGLKKGYLFMYNLVQFLGFSWIFVNMTVTGRNVILFVIFGSLEQMQNKSVVFFVFYLWSTIEIFRVLTFPLLSSHWVYPFYMLACIDTEWKLLTWLRYTIWIPLYPMGTVAVIQSMPVFDEMRLYSLPLPAALGQSLSFSYTLQVYLVVMFLGLFINFRHLYKQRKRRFRSRKRKAN